MPQPIEGATSLTSLTALRGYTLRAIDGELGKVRDCYFDDLAWTVRYLVVHTGSWLLGKDVLIYPPACDRPDVVERFVPVRLTREQVKNSPDVNLARPVSHQVQLQLHQFYGWPMAGNNGAALPGTMTPTVHPKHLAPSDESTTELAGPLGDSSLRSFGEVSGYSIQASDGTIGQVEDLIADDSNWIVRYLVVNTGTWLSGRKVLVAPPWIEGVDWSTRCVAVDLSRKKIRESPPYDPALPIKKVYEARLHDHYARPGYWN